LETEFVQAKNDAALPKYSSLSKLQNNDFSYKRDIIYIIEIV